MTREGKIDEILLLTHGVSALSAASSLNLLESLCCVESVHSWSGVQVPQALAPLEPLHLEPPLAHSEPLATQHPHLVPQRLHLVPQHREGPCLVSQLLRRLYLVLNLPSHHFLATPAQGLEVCPARCCSLYS